MGQPMTTGYRCSAPPYPVLKIEKNGKMPKNKKQNGLVILKNNRTRTLHYLSKTKEYNNT